MFVCIEMDGNLSVAERVKQLGLFVLYWWQQKVKQMKLYSDVEVLNCSVTRTTAVVAGAPCRHGSLAICTAQWPCWYSTVMWPHIALKVGPLSCFFACRSVCVFLSQILSVRRRSLSISGSLCQPLYQSDTHLWCGHRSHWRSAPFPASSLVSLSLSFCVSGSLYLCICLILTCDVATYCTEGRPPFLLLCLSLCLSVWGSLCLSLYLSVCPSLSPFLSSSKHQT